MDKDITRDELTQLIADGVAVYMDKVKQEEQQKKEAEETFNIKLKTAVKEKEEEWLAAAEEQYNKKLEELAAKHGFSLNDTKAEGNQDNNNDSFNAGSELKDDKFPFMKESNSFVNFACAKFLKDKGYKFNSKFTYIPYEEIGAQYAKLGKDAFVAANCDDNCDDDPSAWEVEDCFVGGIWYAIVCRSDILGRVGHRKFDHTKGCGGQVQVKQINVPSPSHDWGDAASLNPCETITCVSNSFTTYTVQIKKYGDLRRICNADEILVGEYQSEVMETMAIRLSERIDNEIMTNLIGATHTYTVDLPVCCDEATVGTSCCEWTIDLYDAIMELEADMRNAGYFTKSNPVLLINPDVAVYLKYRNNMDIPPYMVGNIEVDGTKLVRIGNIEVIETCHANACSGTTNEDMALLIDPDRAFAEVWAQKPKYAKDYVLNCDADDIVVWAYGGFDVLDDAAVGAIRNPSCS
jgi:hypothetical protein